ncbi:dimethylamine monooxygenase subunit DmmA family protein [Caballeronia mineralivorans]|uniref:dimethylamine monooxygenase subunit DmmA family protein n=1 Tax=Caballeronia mineralivorans TaxID=2010198 RepID=UPI00128B7DD7|nr:dimethylamine monooxygenase subunit DmmA family protein [Caballeronia mineralivorans]
MMQIEAIPSTPVYYPVQIAAAATARQHLVIVERAEWLKPEQLNPLSDAAGSLFVYLLGNKILRLSTRARYECRSFNDVQSLWATVEAFLSQARMGLRLYVIGSEPFLWQASAIATRYGMTTDSMQLELAGKPSRNVYCIHCRHTIRDTETNLVTCPSCGKTLAVRAHFSRRLGAYIGVQADAEEPGVLPPVEELRR